MHNRLAKLREKRAQGDGGFTLIELLVVVVIIGILIAIAIPLYLNYKKGANDKSAQSDLRGAVSVLEQCNSNNGGYPASITAVGTNPITSYTACSGQSINVSSGTTMTYSPFTNSPGTTACTTAPCLTYTLTATNSNGSGKTYSYSSWVAGTIS
jgi:type IV pilus assembly protein PilA